MLPNGEKIVHVTVGGRTSAVVPSVQIKTGPVAGDVKGEDTGETEKPQKGKKRKSKDPEETEKDATPSTAAEKAKSKPRKSKFKEELSDKEVTTPVKPEIKKRKIAKTEDEEDTTQGKKRGLLKGPAKPKMKRTKTEDSPAGKRRSNRLSSG